MGKDSFYKHCREGGLVITRKETDYMWETWRRTFREMTRHMQPEPARDSSRFLKMYGYDPSQDDEEYPDDSGDRKLYVARCINGMVRNRASKNAACNCQFQAIVAHGAKLAGWNLLYAGGMADRIAAFVHDEYLYCLRPDELDERIPQIEKLMLDGMRTIIPDVKIGVETTVMTHWDKKAVEFAKLEKDANGFALSPLCGVSRIAKKVNCWKP